MNPNTMILPLLLAIITICHSQPLSIWINNTANPSHPDGSQENPYTSFSDAYNNKILSTLTTDDVIVIFAATNKPYSVSITLSDTQLNHALSLTSNIVFSQDPTLDCNTVPTIEMPDGLSIASENLTIAFSWLNLNFQNSNKAVPINIQTENLLKITITNLCIYHSSSASISSIMNVNSSGQSIVNMANINVQFDMSSTQNFATQNLFLINSCSSCNSDSIFTASNFSFSGDLSHINSNKIGRAHV